MVKYIPKAGDIVLMDFDPTLGHEQRGRRPALVLSNYKYNKKTNFFVCCPITSKVKGYPFEVQLGSKSKTKGVILSDQIKSCDLLVRRPKYVDTVEVETLKEVLTKFSLIIIR